MRGGFDYRAGALFGFGGIGKGGAVFHEDTGANEYGFGAQLHHQGGVGGGGDASGGEIGDGELAGFRDHLYQFVGGGVLFGFGVEFFFAKDGEDFHLLHDLADVLDRVDDVAGAGLPLGTDHGRPFGDAPQGFSKIARSADERNFESVLVDMMSFVGGREHFGFVDVVDAEFLQDLRLRKMPDAALGHHRDGNCSHDLANLFGRGHAGNAAFGADLRRHALKRHNGDSSRLLGDGSLLGVGHIHNYAAF